MSEEVKTEKWGGDLMKKVSAYYDDRIAIICDLKKLNYEEPIKADAFLLTLCVKGKASLFIDGKSYDIRENDLLIYHPNIIMEKCMVSMDFENRTIVMTPEYVRQMPILAGDDWDVRLFLEKNPIVPLKEEEVGVFCQYYDLLQSKLTTVSPGRHHKELIDSLLAAFLFEFHDALERFVQIKPQTFTSSENLFKAFMDLLSSSYPKDRSVMYYADRLHVSPKYLSAVCKEVSRCTASELINRYVIKDIEYQLKRTRKSIKEIACELDFPNLSFFGKYVKRHLKMSPREYRDQCADQSL